MERSLVEVDGNKKLSDIPKNDLQCDNIGDIVKSEKTLSKTCEVDFKRDEKDFDEFFDIDLQNAIRAIPNGLAHSKVACSYNDNSLINGNKNRAPIVGGNLEIIDAGNVNVGDHNLFKDKVTFNQFVIQPTVTNLPNDKVISPNKESKQIGVIWKLKILKRKKILIWSLIVFTLAVIIICATTVYFIPRDIDDILPTNETLRIVTKGEWFGLPSTSQLNLLKIRPAPIAMISHTVTSECKDTPTCSALVRNIQASHIALDYDDIGYNFLVGGDGNVYEGRGWDKEGAHTLGFNQISIGVAFIGNFITVLPTNRQLRAAQLLLERGVTLDKLTPNYKLYCQKQVQATESPGKALIQEIIKWPHWSPYEKKPEY